MGNFKRYHPVNRCRKCGNTAAVRYIAQLTYDQYKAVGGTAEGWRHAQGKDVQERRCHGCGFIWYERPIDANVEASYQEVVREACAVTRRRTVRRVANAIATHPLLSKDKRAADLLTSLIMAYGSDPVEPVISEMAAALDNVS